MAAGNYEQPAKGPITKSRASDGVISSFAVGQKTVTTPGTEVALATTRVLRKGVTVKALATNTGEIYVGLNPVTATTGFVLEAGEEVFIPIDNISKIYVDAETGGEGVSFFGY